MLVPLLLLITATEAQWSWPVDTSHGVTSSFGEYRGVRFHMGLDFSTGGVEGEPLRAARPGTIFKVRATFNGFGRVVYVRHDTGHITVYAHLARFGPKLEQYIKSKNRHPLDWFGTMEPGLAVDSKEILAWTGESGAGMPHLHFEVRDKANRPIDPLSLDFPKLQGLDKPALLKGITLTPLDEGSTVNGGKLPFSVTGNPGKLQAFGNVGLLLFSYAQGSRGSRTGLRGLRVKQDGVLVGEWMPRHLDFAHNGIAGLVFDQARSGFGPTTYTYCFDNRNKWLPDVNGYKQEQVIRVEQDTTLTIELMNLNGTWRSYQLVLGPKQARRPASKPFVFPLQSTSLKVDAFADRLYFKSDGLDGTLQLPNKMIGMAKSETLPYSVARGQKGGDLFWRTEAGNLQRTLGSMPGTRSFDYKLENWTISGRKAILAEQAIMTGPVDHKIRADTLEYHSSVLWFGRPGIPTPGLKAAYDTSKLPNLQYMGLYGWSFHKKRWSYLAGPEKGKLEANLRNPVPVVIARDISPPVIMKPKYHNYYTGRRVVIPVRDRGTGIDRDSVKVENKSGPLRGEYDGDRGWIILPRGTQKGPWRVTLSDKAGHQVSESGLNL